MKKILFFLFFILMSIGSAFGVNVNIGTYATNHSWVNSTAYSTINIDANVTAVGLTNGNNSKYYSSNSSWRHYEGDGGTITISTTSGTISSITFTYSSGNNGVIKYNGSNKTSGTVISVSGTSISFSVGHSSGSKNGNVQITQISVTYSGVTSYTITAQSNNESYGTVSLSDKIITASPNSGYTYASPAYTVVSGTATVSQGTGANINKFTVTPTSNCTIRINFEPLPKYTVNLKINETLYSSVTQSEYGETINLTDSIPNISRLCQLNGWQFVGWINSNDKDNRNLITTITPTKNTTLYALFKILEEGGENIVDTLTKNSFPATTTEYIEFTINAKSGTQYYGYTAGDNSAIQLSDAIHHKSTLNCHSGIVTTSSSGIATNVKIVWNSNTADRTLQIHPSDTAFHHPDNLWNNGVQTEYESIIKGINTQVDLNASFIGIRSKSSALYLDTIFITWTTASYEYSTNPKCYETSISVAEWFEDSVKFDIGDYESIYKYDGTTNPFNSCDSIRIKITNSNGEECIRWFQVPIFGGAHTIKNDCNCDVVVLHDSAMTISSNIENSNVYVYGTLIVNQNKTYTVNSLTLRRDNDSVPQLLYNGTLDIKNGMFFEMRTDGEDWRWLTLPDSIRLKEIFGKSEVLLKYYDGEIRANNGRGGWQFLQNDTTFGLGVIFGINDDRKMIYTFELDTNILSLEKASGNKHIKVKKFYKSGKPKNDLGWNLVGNPFLTTYNVNEEFGSIFNVSDSLVKEIINGQWTGRWDTIDNTTGLRYIVVPSNKKDQHIIDAGGYEQICLRNGYKLKPFTSFFIQAKNNGELIFFHGQRIANAPLKNHQNINKETFLQINIGSLKTGCYISNKFNDDYEIGDDMESLYQTYQLINGYKLLYSAINDSIINNGITFYTASGNLTLDEKTDVNEFSEINVLYNGHWYDLLHGETLNVNESFILQAVRNQNDISTGLNETIINASVKKFIHNGYIYVVRDNEIYSILGEKIR